MALFKLQIVREDGSVVHLPGGGPLEVELVSACQEAITRRGVGVTKTKAQVAIAVREGITEVIRGLKADTRKVVR